MTRVYLRVSAKKEETGLSFQSQLETIRSSINGDPLEVYQDVGSGRYVKKRLQLLQDMKPRDKVVVPRLDRISRSLKDLTSLVEMFCQREVTFTSINESFNLETVSGKFLVNVMGAVTLFDSEINGQRVK